MSDLIDITNAPPPDDPAWELPIRERWKTAQATAFENLSTIRTNMGAEREADFQRRLARIVLMNSSVKTRLRALYQLVAEHTAYITQNVACKRGCSHCCHTAVPIAPVEAQMIGDAIGLSPKPQPPVPLRSDQFGNIDGFDWGYHNPCAFLKDGACSIYEHRPLTCRVHFNLDSDDVLCHLYPPVGHMVPWLDMNSYREAYFMICGTVNFADIRKFFPRESSLETTSKD